MARIPQRWRRRLVGLVGVLALFPTGCQWMFGGFTADGTRFNPLESNLGVAEVPAMHEAWIGLTGGVVVSSPAWADGRVFVGSNDGNVYAFSFGGDGCSGTPLVCQPLWTAAGGGSSSPAVVNGQVYVTSGGTLSVFDAAGATNCAGAPKVCQPLWTASGAGSSSPVVDSGMVYVAGGSNPGTVSAFDAAGVSGCGGSPKTCSPLWSAFTTNCGPIPIHCSFASPSVANGVLYIGSTEGDELGGSGFLYAFSATGTAGCSGVPRMCAPLWATFVGDVRSAPAIAGGSVYVNSSTVTIEFTGAPLLSAVDATTGGVRWSRSVGASQSTPALAYDRVFVAAGNGLRVFDTAGNDMRSGPIPNSGGSPFVSDGVVYVAGDNKLSAFDAVGNQGCPTSTGPCAPIWTAPVPDDPPRVPSPSENVGTVFVGSSDHALHVFRPA